MGLRGELLDLRDRLDALTLSKEPRRPAAQLIPWPEKPVIPVGGDIVEAREVGDESPLELSERDTIARALARNGGSRKRTALELRISERTLYRKMKEYGIGQPGAPTL